MVPLCLTILSVLCTLVPLAAAAPFAQRTDDVTTKLSQLDAAYASGDLDLARALAASLRWRLAFDRQERLVGTTPDLPAATTRSVADLPASWAQWAHPWRHCRVLAVTEPVGLSRLDEPVDLLVAFPADQVADLHREVRVARLNTDGWSEVVSQVYDVRRAEDGVTAHVLFQARLDSGATATYLLLHNNPSAERPDYETDLTVQGEGVGLRVGNRHFEAHLSPQMGQLERIVSRRMHGVELYAGGKGHGEPPTVDWSNDYVDEGHFQKLRIRAWPEAPDVDIVRGPLMVRVRRYGFPASPLHPVYTPSRILIDQTYEFHAGADWFRKQGVMRAVADVDISALRDDEWVMSGYSFDRLLWIDADGQLREGPVPGAHAADLWGVGFYHTASRDAFLAVYLDHSADGLQQIRHAGSPSLHYYHHGQLWARYPAGSQKQLQAGARINNDNAYRLFAWPDAGAADSVSVFRQRLLNPLQVAAQRPPKRHVAVGTEPLARRGERPSPRKALVWDALAQVKDEQLYSLPVGIVDLGYVYDVRLRGDVAHILVSMPHRGRPLWRFLESKGGGRVSDGIRESVLRIDGIRDVVVEPTWEPAWTTARLSPAARAALGLPDQALPIER